MASKKSKATNPTKVNGVPAVTDSVNAAAGADAPSRSKLQATSPKVADGGGHRTKKPKTKPTEATKANSAQDQKDPAQAGKLSALDAAAKVLQEAGQAMNCQGMIEAMAAKGYWTSPAGKTPASTLYSAIMREIKIKSTQARFQKTTRGHFVYQTPQAS